VYRYAQTAAQLQRLLGNYGFETVDRNAIVNMSKASVYDAETRTVYFDEGANGEGAALYATVSGANTAKVRHLIRESAGIGEAYAYGDDIRKSYAAAIPAA
jgi:hypothetical protein